MAKILARVECPVFFVTHGLLKKTSEIGSLKVIGYGVIQCISWNLCETKDYRIKPVSEMLPLV